MAERKRKTKYGREGRTQMRSSLQSYDAYPGYEDMIAREVAEEARSVAPRERMTEAQRRQRHKAEKQAQRDAKRQAKEEKKRAKQARADARSAAAQQAEMVEGEDAGTRRRAFAARSRRTREEQTQREMTRRQRRRARRREAREVKPFRFQEVRHRPVLYRSTDSRKADRIYKITLVCALAAIAVFVSCVFFEVRTVRSDGSSRYSGEEVVYYSGIESGKKMLFLNVGKAASNILSELPYIKSVSIRRIFPSTVVIDVEERSPAAKIVDGNFSYIIDDEGYLLEYTVAGSRFDLPLIVCPAPTRQDTGRQLAFADPLMLETLQNVLSHIVRSEWIADIDSINIQRIYDVSFSYQGRFAVKLGDTSDLDMKLRLLREVIARNTEDASGTIDISSTERVSFQPSR